MMAALREFEEELGLRPEVLADGGCLPRHFVYASDNLIDPILLIIGRPELPWRPDPAEVDEVIEVPLSQLADHPKLIMTKQRRPLRYPGTKDHSTGKTIQGEVAGHLEFNAPAYDVDGRHIWGATAMILSHLVQRLLPCT